MERVILVDEADREIGDDEKGSAHRGGRLHRAFSIFVFDDRGRLLLQRRAPGKYHSGGRWSNTCCGHPRPGEPLEEAVHRRLREEMGFDCGLVEVATYRYTAPLEGGLVENEIDHLFAGRFAGTPAPDPEEAAAWRWAEPARLLRDVGAAPQRYTAWLGGSLAQVLMAVIDRVEPDSTPRGGPPAAPRPAQRAGRGVGERGRRFAHPLSPALSPAPRGRGRC